jgi:beta-mannosidase
MTETLLHITELIQMAKSSLDLTGEWEFKEYPISARRMRDLQGGDWAKTKIPCSVFTSLIDAGIISRTDIDTHPEKFGWVSERPWVYKKTFELPEEMKDCDRVELFFEGLDTITSIWLNDKLIGKTDNMFVEFRFDVTNLLRPAGNTLMVKFEPAVQYAQKLMSRYTKFSESDFKNPYRVYIRKAQYQFGWDFCPCLVGCGIWKPLRLQGFKMAAFDDINIRTIDCNEYYADIKIDIRLDSPAKTKLLSKIKLDFGKDSLSQTITFEAGDDFHSTVIHIKEPALWWPKGYGEQNLYKCDIQLFDGDELIDQSERKTGLRIVKLNLSDDKKQDTFQFEINYKPIFARGANWVPPDIFAGSVTDEDYEKLLLAAAESNINILRVWGGGYYESDKFYELCDELGIMVWQDFMFACAYYPDRQFFIEKIKTEAQTVIKRLRRHPCLIIWCGNNEIDSMHNSGRLGKSKKFHGKDIYHRILGRLIQQLDCDTAYIPTTPLSKDGKFKKQNMLTTHQWQVWSEHQPVRKYLSGDIPYFVTEFGFQSLPCMETLKKICPADRLHIGEQILEKHNYQLDGNSRISRYSADLFAPTGDLEEFVFNSQITQARASKQFVEHLRTHNQHNHGVLFWQFNEPAPAISWSAIDYYKNPKALYYYGKRFFAGLLVGVVPGYENQNIFSCEPPESLNVIAVNDTPEPITATINCQLIDLFGNVLDKVVLPIAIGPFSRSTPVKMPRAIVKPKKPDKSCLFVTIEKDSATIAQNLFFYLPDKYIDWPKVDIKKRLEKIKPRKWILNLSSSALAKDVHIEPTTPAVLSDNFLDILPCREAHIIMDFAKDISIKPSFRFNCVNQYCQKS